MAWNQSECDKLASASSFDRTQAVEGYVVFFNIFFVLFSIPYLILTLAWAISRRRHQHLSVRYLEMTAMSTVGTFLILILSPSRDVLGRAYFQCSTLTVMFTLSVPLVIAPVATRILMVHYRSVYQNAILRLTSRGDHKTQLVQSSSNPRKFDAREASSSRSMKHFRESLYDRSKKNVSGELNHDVSIKELAGRRLDSSESYNAQALRDTVLSVFPVFRKATNSNSSKERNQVQRKEPSGKKQRRSKNDRDSLRRVYQYTSGTHSIKLFVGVYCAALVSILILWAPSGMLVFPNCLGCFFPREFVISVSIPTFMGCVVFLCLIWIWKDESDAFGLWWELRTTVLIWALCFSFYFPFELSDPGGVSAKERFNWSFFLYIALLASHTLAVTVQVLRTYLPDATGRTWSPGVAGGETTWLDFEASRIALWMWKPPSTGRQFNGVFANSFRSGSMLRGKRKDTLQELEVGPKIDHGIEESLSESGHLGRQLPVSKEETPVDSKAPRSSRTQHEVWSRANALVRGGIRDEAESTDCALLVRLEDVLGSPEGFDFFRTFCAAAFKVELLELYRETSVWKNEFQSMSRVGAIQIAEFIMEDFLDIGGVLEVQSITCDQACAPALERVRGSIDSVGLAAEGTSSLKRSIFDEIITISYSKMETLLFPQFCASQLFEQYVYTMESLGGIGDDCMPSVSARFSPVDVAATFEEV